MSMINTKIIYFRVNIFYYFQKIFIYELKNYILALIKNFYSEKTLCIIMSDIYDANSSTDMKQSLSIQSVRTDIKAPE